MIARILICAGVLTLLTMRQPETVHAGNLDAVHFPESQSTGIVIGYQGLATVHRADLPEGHALRAGERLHAAEEIRLQDQGHVELLWNGRAVFSMYGNTRMRLLESIGRQTRVQLLGGTARFAYAYNEGHPADTIALLLVSDALLIMRGGIVEVESHTSGQVVRVVEGQVSVETASTTGKQVLVKAGQGLEIRTGTLNTPQPSVATLYPGLAAMEQHRAVPYSIVQRLAHIHVQQALELEERIRRAAEDDDNPHAEESGLILSTSLGIPVSPLPSGTALTSPIASTTTPPVAAPSLPVPPAPLPPPAAPTIITLSPAQVGGINTATVLQNTLKTVLGTR
jgi:hypothetical protein